MSMVNDALAGNPGSIVILGTLICVLIGILVFLLSDASGSTEGVTRQHISSAAVIHNHARKKVISVTLDGILYSKTGSPQPGLTIHEDAAEAIEGLCRAATVVAIAKVASSDEEETVRSLVTRLKLFEHGLEPHRLLFCSTDYGRGCMVRQLNPTLHFESSPDVVRNLEGKGVNISLVASPTAEKQLECSPGASGLTFVEALSVLKALGIDGV